MLFLLNDAVYSLKGDDLKVPLAQPALNELSLEQVSRLGAELFAANPTLHRTDLKRAHKLAALIIAKWPTINAALFVPPKPRCDPSQVMHRFADVALDVISGLSRRQLQGSLTTQVVDEHVWKRLAA